MLNRFRNWLRTWLLGSAAAIIAPIEEEARKGPVFSTGAVAQISRNRGLLTPMSAAPVFATRRQVFEAARPVFAGDDAGATAMAQDWNGSQALSWAVEMSYGGEGIGFLGYPYLAELSQRPEYRRISEIPAEEMTRKWIRFTSKSGGDKKEVIAKLTEACESFKLRERFRQMAELDGLFGRAQLFVDIKGTRDDREELKTPLVVDKRKIEKGSLLGFNIVEPMWSYPLQYNSDNPLRPDFFVPQSWSVQGFEVHRSRLLTFIGRPMPDLLKPAYAFGGLSLSQMALPYVNNWIRTRQSVSDLIHAFSIMVLATNMSNTLDVGAMADLIKRVEAAVAFRDNRGLQVVDKESEELTNVSAPLNGLHELQAQSQEQMASVAQIPLIKLLAITPSGLNASTDGEIRVFYDHVKAGQEKFFGDNLRVALDLIQLHEFGSIDEDIGYEFIALWELDEAGQAAIEKSDADTAAVYIEAGVIDPEEERDRLKADPKGKYVTLKGSAPEPPEMDDVDGADPAGNPARTAEPRKTEMAGDAGGDLYVRRNLTPECAAALTAWALAEGFTNVTPPEEMHATVVYSRAPVELRRLTGSILADGGPRAVEPLGDIGAVVLRFECQALSDRWRAARDAGASWDYLTGYRPHVTISYDAGGMDLSAVRPFGGPLAFGPEIHAPLDEDWAVNKGYRAAAE